MDQPAIGDKSQHSEVETNYQSPTNVTTLNEIVDNTHVIIIEELQFFQDAYDTVINWCDIKHKTIIAAGLDGDFLKNPFGDVLRLIPHAEKITKLSALCKKCGNGTLAHFTKRITNDCQTTLVGSDDVYEAVCRKHFF